MKKNLKSLHSSEYVKRFEYEQSPNRLGRLMSLISLSNHMAVCDFGCGNGMLMEQLCTKVAEYSGVDFSEDFIAAANLKKQDLGFCNASFFCEDITHFCDSHKGEFNIAFAMDISEHVYDKNWVQILTSIHSTLKHNGILYLHTPNADFFVEKMKQRNFLIKQFPEHIAVRNAAHNSNLIQQAGFSSIRVFKLPHYNTLKYIHPFSKLPLIGKFFEARLFIQAAV
jgi:2-polyprenyl-3-methyl-5-hydroxy-6-metoxy-1,4-benzoquinol methylase